MVFHHSVKVPTQYRKAAAIFRQSITERKSVKSLVYSENHAKKPNLLALFNKYSQHKDIIENIIESTRILVDNPRLDPCLCRVLITELLFGVKQLKGESKPVNCVRSYLKKFEEYLDPKTDRNFTHKGIKPRYVRINTNLISKKNLLKILTEEGWKNCDKNIESYEDYLEAIKTLPEDEYLFDFHIPDVLVFHSKWRNHWAGHELTLERKVMLQDKATCIASNFLRPKPDSVVLDMCAAPGMKTIHLSNIMKNTGTIYAVEKDEERYQLLEDMIKESNTTNVKTINADILTIGDKDVQGVEYILLDPSCSGSGMQSRIDLIRDESKNINRIRRLSALQIKLLTHAMTSFPNVKKIVYSTCSLHEEENEQVVHECLKNYPNFKLLNGKKLLQRQWKNVGNIKYERVGKNCIYALPDDDFTDGIFIAIFEKIL